MSTSHPGALLHAYLDRELSAERSLDIDAHLATCSKCRAELDAAQHLRSLLRQHRVPSVPSPELLSKLHKAIHPRRTRPWQWAMAAAAVVVSVGVATRALDAADRRGPELVSAHLRSLQSPTHLTDVASSDRHQVKPYFQGRIDYAFPVKDFADAGYPLEGGRVDVLGERPVAALVYRSNAHVINAFVHRTDFPSRERAWSRNGFNLYRFDDPDGYTVELVSDAAPETLAALARAWRE